MVKIQLRYLIEQSNIVNNQFPCSQCNPHTGTWGNYFEITVFAEDDKNFIYVGLLNNLVYKT